MKKLESSLTNMVVSLMSFAIVIGALLAWVNHVTEAPIRLQEKKVLSDGIKSVMGGGAIEVVATDTLKKVIEGKEQAFVVYTIKSSEGSSLGMAVESSVMGFGGDMKVLVGFDNAGKILGYTILQTSETPGLGAKADTWFQQGGKGNIIGCCPATYDLTVKKDGGKVDAITASTITSRAFLKAVRQAYDVVQTSDTDGNTSATKKADGTTAASTKQHKQNN